MDKIDNLVVLVVGGGGREHALYEFLQASPRVKRVLCTPGNAGIHPADRRSVGEMDFEGLFRLVQEENIDFVVVGPEAPLVGGIVDYFFDRKFFRVFGPTARAARLEGSKIFTKEIATMMGVPTASYCVARSYEEAEAYIESHDEIPVVKADGLCGGKGVAVPKSKEEALAFCKELFAGKFGSGSTPVLLEERLVGRECSVHSLSDGQNVVVLPSARDHKRLLDGDHGPNTGGMGAYAPVPDVDYDLMRTIKERIVIPMIEGMCQYGEPYEGVLYTGLMVPEKGLPKLLECNCRFGDPETQVMLPLLFGQCDLVKLMLDVLEPYGLADAKDYYEVEGAAVGITLAAQGYPENPRKGDVIDGLYRLPLNLNVRVSHAGTKDGEAGQIVTSGGRVATVTGTAKNHYDATRAAYTAAGIISFAGMQYRKDIGFGHAS